MTVLLSVFTTWQSVNGNKSSLSYISRPQFAVWFFLSSMLLHPLPFPAFTACSQAVLSVMKLTELYQYKAKLKTNKSTNFLNFWSLLTLSVVLRSMHQLRITTEGTSDREDFELLLEKMFTKFYLLVTLNWGKYGQEERDTKEKKTSKDIKHMLFIT